MNLLLIHRDPRILEILHRGAQMPGIHRVTAVDSIEPGVRHARWKVDAIIFDLKIERFNGVRVERALRRANPNARLVAIGPSVPGSAAFRLASIGVTAFLDLPIDEERVERCLRALVAPPDLLIHAARMEVGARDLKQAQRAVRLSMCDEALVRTAGSRRAAARLLGVDRRAVQKIAEELPAPHPVRPWAPKRPPLDRVDPIAPPAASEPPSGTFG
jgi:ActR/RegA family two-component response regulator